jgi:hypothetical protein
MTYLAGAVAIIWCAGAIFFAMQHLNDVRLVQNNLVPGARYTGLTWNRWKFMRITQIDPALLTETGLGHLKTAVRHERIIMAWLFGGSIPLAWAGTVLHAS